MHELRTVLCGARTRMPGVIVYENTAGMRHRPRRPTRHTLRFYAAYAKA